MMKILTYEDVLKKQYLEDIKKSPQAFLNSTIRRSCTKDIIPFLKIALQQGATLSHFKPEPPLIYYAKRSLGKR